MQQAAPPEHVVAPSVAAWTSSLEHTLFYNSAPGTSGGRFFRTRSPAILNKMF